MIHIIDDDQLYRDLFETLIQEFGFDVKGFVSGTHYLNYMTLDQYQLPKVIFTDMNMPGKSGLATAYEIKKCHPHVPCYIATGSPGQLDHVDIDPINGVLRKPLSPKKLKEIIASLC